MAPSVVCRSACGSAARLRKEVTPPACWDAGGGSYQVIRHSSTTTTRPPWRRYRRILLLDKRYGVIDEREQRRRVSAIIVSEHPVGYTGEGPNRQDRIGDIDRIVIRCAPTAVIRNAGFHPKILRTLSRGRVHVELVVRQDIGEGLVPSRRRCRASQELVATHAIESVEDRQVGRNECREPGHPLGWITLGIVIVVDD